MESDSDREDRSPPSPNAENRRQVESTLRRISLINEKIVKDKFISFMLKKLKEKQYKLICCC